MARVKVRAKWNKLTPATWAQIAVCWATDPDRALETARRYFRFAVPGWKVQSELPIRRVVVYRNGVAYFERAGHVEKEDVRFKMRQTEVDVPAVLAQLQARRLVEPLHDGTSYSEHPLVRDYYRDRDYRGPRAEFYEHDRGFHRGWYHHDGDREVIIRRHHHHDFD